LLASRFFFSSEIALYVAINPPANVFVFSLSSLLYTLVQYKHPVRQYKSTKFVSRRNYMECVSPPFLFLQVELKLVCLRGTCLSFLLPLLLPITVMNTSSYLKLKRDLRFKDRGDQNE